MKEVALRAGVESQHHYGGVSRVWKSLGKRGVSRTLIAAGLAAMSVVPLRAQSGADLDLFGPEPEVKKVEQGNPVVGFLVRALGGGPPSAPGRPGRPAVEGLAHTITFQDGRELRGELVSLLKDEIIWKRGDASAPMRFSRADVRRIALTDSQQQGVQYQQQMDNSAMKPDPKPKPATVKLPGNDWLHAEVTSGDGQSFSVSMGGDSKFNVPRSAIEWLYFGESPVPASNLASGAMGLEGWVRSNAKAKLEEKDGWITVKDADWVGRNVSPPPRFEVAFDIKATDERATSLWIQPFGPQPNCYGTGTVQLQFSPGTINRCIYINNLAHENSTMPKDAGPDGRASFRVLYDGLDGKLLVYRNGKQVGDWKLKDEKEKPQPNNWQRGINGICLERSGGPTLGRFTIKPWDGALPKEPKEAKEGEAPAAPQDILSIGKEAPAAGKLESMTEKEITFSGEKKTRGQGTFLQLSTVAKPATGSDSKLLFGNRGEMGAGNLEIKDGRASFSTSFAEKIDAPLSALQVIGFAQAAAKPVPSGALVFRNGDELPGALLRAENGAPLKWKTMSGQEIEFQPERLAGVRLAAGEEKQTEGATLEMRDGDRLRGELSSFDGKQVKLKHATLGELTVPMERLWSLFPNPKTAILDAANDPSPWKANINAVHLDGRYIVRNATSEGYYNSEGRMGISRELKGMPEKFELRCEAVDVSGSEPNLGIRLASSEAGRGSSSTLDMDFNYGSLRLYGWVASGRSRSFWKDVPLRERNGRYEPVPRLSVRLFVDNKVGTVDVYVNGVHRVKSGQNVNERVPGVAGSLTISGYSSSQVPVVLSDIWAGPWNGELPRPGDPPGVALSNGDMADGVPKEFRKGKLVVDPGSGEMEVPLDRVSAVAFGGKTEAVKSPGRIRLLSGDAVCVETFKFEDGELRARSKTLGEIKLPATAIRELVFNAVPVRFPTVAEPKKKTAEAEKAEPVAPPGVPVEPPIAQ